MQALISTPAPGTGLRNRSVLLAVTLMAGGALSFAPSAARADLVCQAAASNPPSCPRAAFLGETVVVDFSSVISANPNLFGPTAALTRGNQIRISTTTNGPLNLSKVRLLASGQAYDPNTGLPSGAPYTNLLMPAWEAAPTSPSAGVTNFAPTDQLGVAAIYKQASFTLSSTGNITGRGFTNNAYTSLQLVFENATLAAQYPSLNISLLNYASGTGPSDPSASSFGANGTLGVPAPLPLLGGAAAFGWSRRLRRRLSAAKMSV